MKAKPLPIIFCLFAVSVFGQENETRKRTEFGLIPCNYFSALVLSAYKDYKKLPDAKIYVVYYEAKNQEVFVWNAKKKVEEKKTLKPRRGNAFNRAGEVPLFLETVYQLPKEKVVLINGGFRENLAIEIWLVPKNAFPPEPTPTIDAKDVKFAKGKPSPIRNCAFGDTPQLNY